MKTDIPASLANLQAMSAQTHAAEQRILSHAEAMIDRINGDIEAAAVGAKSGDPDEAARYQALVLERGKLNVIAANARATLGMS